jgi:hypothetical protein
MERKMARGIKARAEALQVGNVTAPPPEMLAGAHPVADQRLSQHGWLVTWCAYPLQYSAGLPVDRHWLIRSRTRLFVSVTEFRLSGYDDTPSE